MSKTRGRKPKLTPEVIEKICKGVSLGMAYKHAASMAGISESSFYAWKERAEGAKSGIYLDFLEALKEAESKGVAANLQNINATAQGREEVVEIREGIDAVTGKPVKVTTKKYTGRNWQASAWILERRHPEEYGRKDKLEHSGEVNLPVFRTNYGVDDIVNKVKEAKIEQDDTAGA